MAPFLRLSICQNLTSRKIVIFPHCEVCGSLFMQVQTFSLLCFTKEHDLLVTNCYYTFFSTYNQVTTRCAMYLKSSISARDSLLIFYSWKIGASFTYAQHEFVAFLWTQSFRLQTICYIVVRGTIWNRVILIS